MDVKTLRRVYRTAGRRHCFPADDPRFGALMLLDESDRALILEVLFDGRSYRAIGALRGYSAIGARKRVDRILARLVYLIEHR